MNATDSSTEYIVALEGSAPFLDVVFETIEAHISRTGEEYAEIITGVDALEAGDVGHDEEAAVHLYVLGSVPPDEALDLIDLALDRIADENTMGMARQTVQVEVPDAPSEEEESEE
jgi:hypothetical protein